jgi:hypothetical protein
MTRVLAAVAVVLVLAATASGCGGNGSAAPQESPGAFITRILQEEISGRWAAQWGELHPGHQRLITRAQYVTCSEAIGTNVGNGKETFDVRAVRDQAIHVPGVPERTAKLVTIRLRRPDGVDPVTYHLHAVLDGGRWTWILGASFLDALKQGRCLDGSPLSRR